MTAAREPDRGAPGASGGIPPCRSPVPAGMRLRPDPGMLILAGGSVLVGGSPLRLLRLAPRGAALARGWWDGAPVPGRPAAQALARRLLDAGLAHPDPAGGPPGPGPDEVTAVIPVRDRPAELASCLAGLAGLRVIVVDDGSADHTAVAAAAAAAGALCLRRDRSGGTGAARNTGLATVRTPLVAFIDSDCVPRPGWLTQLLPHFADPAVGAAAPRIVAHERGHGWLAQYEEARSALDMGPAESIVRPGARVPYVPGAALVVRRAAAAAGFAADMPVGEDVDFVWRLVAAGWHVRYEPRAAVGHQHRVRLSGWLRRRRDYGTSAAPLELRHPGTVPACTMSGWSALAWAAAAAGRPATGAAITGAAAALLARRLGPFTDDAWPLAGRLAGRGTLAAGRLLGSAVARTWWPVALPAAAAIPRLRLPLAAALIVPPVLDWRQRRPPMPPPGYVAARLLDDLAYSVGVWQGCLAHRTARPLLPALWWWSPAGEPGGPRPGYSPVGVDLRITASRTVRPGWFQGSYFESSFAGIMSRTEPVYRILVSAAGSDPDAAALLAEQTRHRQKGQAQIARVLARAGALRPKLREREAADIIHALMSPEVYRLLVGDRGWQPERYEQWLKGILTDQLLPTPTSRASG